MVQQNRDTVQLPYGIIEDANYAQWLDTLSYFTLLKSLYFNNTVYNYSIRKLASLIGCSPATMKKHLKVMEREHLVRYTGKNITFLGLEKLKELTEGSHRHITIRVNRKKQLSILRNEIIRCKVNQQSYNLNRYATEYRPHRDLIILSNNENIVDYVGIGAQGIGKEVYRSKSTGQRLRKDIVQLGILQTERVIQRIGTVSTRDEYYDMHYAGTIPKMAKCFNGMLYIDRHPMMIYLDQSSHTLCLSGR